MEYNDGAEIVATSVSFRSQHEQIEKHSTFLYQIGRNQ